MKTKLLFSILFLYTFQGIAKEGMWLPFLLQQVNEVEMKAMGMQISAKDIYDINQGSLKDAVAIFGGGCTGEMVSDKGLILTNHHCGYGSVQRLSSLQNNYLTQGFFAQNQEQEIPCAGLSVTFIVSIENVTTQMFAGTTHAMSDSVKYKIITSNKNKLEAEQKSKTGYIASVKSFYYNNEYYLFLMEKFTDIRLVAFPPNGIGKFGGDTDNWMWPRHTGDFGLFRIYAGQDNKPAEYNKSNKPFVPRKSFTINAKGIKENDFAMVYGFPGRTQEYLTSSGVAEIMNVLDPARIKIRSKRLSIMKQDMDANEETFIQYASKQASIANYYKKWMGELEGLKINNAIEKKKKIESAFKQWVQADSKRKIQYGGIVDSIHACYRKHERSIKLNEYVEEIIWASELLKKGEILERIGKAIDTLGYIDSLVAYKREMDQFYKTINIQTDYKITKALFDIYRKDIGEDQWVSDKNVEAMYTQSVLCDPKLFNDFISLRDRDALKKIIIQDPIFSTYTLYDQMQKVNKSILIKELDHLLSFYTVYIKGLQEFNSGKKMYPDANSTLRLSYGKIEGLKKKNGSSYNYFTTLDEAVKKHNEKVEEFNMPLRLRELQKNKDYGRYAINVKGKKTVPIGFIASNHTTGGNSGSPVINAKGELIGTNFDRIWEGTMSDVMYDINLCRNISLDIRYTLFIIEKYGQAKWLIDEMNVLF
ncbi:MAG: S46 family peptidase [Chitinophagaceae bacterium]